MRPEGAGNDTGERRIRSSRRRTSVALLLIVGLVWAAVPARAALVYACGANVYGQLGERTKLSYSLSPIALAGFNNVRAIAGGLDISLALKSDGTVWAWGENQLLGEPGNFTPTEVSGLSDVAAVAGGWSHSLALKSDGTVWAWGSNYYGELGNGTTTDSSVPVEVIGLTGVSSISGGDSYSLALKSDGTVWAWGLNNYGQFGNGTTGSSSVPVEVIGLSGVTAIAAGAEHCLALKMDGTVYAWGADFDGELGDGAIGNSNVPVEVEGLSGISAIAAGNDDSLALKTDGTVWAWGQNECGELGDGTITDRGSPVEVIGLSGVKAISAGYAHSVALKSDGTVWVWGNNEDGQLCNGTANYSTLRVEAILTDVTAIAAGGFHTLAIAGEMTAPTTTASLMGPAGQSGWYTGPVTVTLSAADPDNPPDQLVTYFALDGGTQQTYTAPLTVSGDARHTLSFWSEDDSGNQEATQTLAIPIDSTAPTLSFGAPSPVANAAGWNNSAVTIAYTTADNLSGVDSSTPASPVHLITAGKGVTKSVKAADVAGNSATFISPPINIDLTPPVTTPTLTGPTGADGTSFAGPVQVKLSAADNLSGVFDSYYTVDGGTQQTYTQPFSIAADGTHVLVYWSVDVAGNAEATHTANITVDSTPPTLSFGGPSPAANLAGWNNTTVTIPFTTADSGSGVASVVPPGPLRFTAEGKNQTESVTVTDKAGNSASFTSPPVNIDVTPPVTTLSFSGPAGADSSSFTGPVQVKLSATDSLSGVSATYYTLDGGPQQTYAQPFTIAADGKHKLIYWSVDAAGNLEADHTQAVLVDTSIPAITITAPQNQVYLLNQVVDAAYTGADTEDGVTTTTGPVASGSPIDTASVGVKSFTVKATDTAGNTSQASVSYTVSYGVKLLYDPTMAGSPGAPEPVSLQLVDAAGNNVSSPSVTLRAVSVARPGDQVSSGSGPTFTFDPLLGGTGGYVFNLNTTSLPAGALSLNFIAGSDPTIHQAIFTIAGPVVTVPTGISLISVPLASTGDLAALFGVQVFSNGSADVAIYDGITNEYLLYPHLPGTDGKSGLPGRGYWVEESSPTRLPGSGAANPNPLDIVLSPGWNMIGDPYAVSLTTGSLQLALGSGQPGLQFMSEAAAVSAGIMGGTIWAYDTGAKQYTAAASLSPFAGYWIYIDPAGSGGQPVTVRFTEPDYSGVPISM